MRRAAPSGLPGSGAGKPVFGSDASDISAQVDGIAAGVSATEEALRGLDVAPALQREEAPRFLTQKD